jgi:hypothetical protein
LLTLLANRLQRCRCHRRRRVARGRLEQDVGLQPDFEELFGDQKAVVFVGHGDGPAESDQPIEPFQRILEQREIIDQAEKLLRVMRSRQRPQTGPGPSTEDDRTNHRGVHFAHLQTGPGSTRREGIWEAAL